MRTRNSYSMALGILFGIMSGTAAGDDTEIYVGDVSAADGVILPNVLFILDTSSSMTNTDNTGITRLDRMKEAMREIIRTSNNVKMGMMRFHKEGGPVLYPVSNIHAAVDEVEQTSESDLSIVLASSADDAEEDALGGVALGNPELQLVSRPDLTSAVTLTSTVAHGDDDAEEYVSTGAVKVSNSTDLELMREGSELQTVGVRFLNVGVPAGADLQSAAIRFQLDETTGVNSAVSINIHGEASTSSARFNNSTGNISLRPKTDTPVGWDPETGLGVGDFFFTPDLSSIVDDIIALPGWTAGNPMTFVFTHAGGSGVRVAESYNGSTSGAARLEIQYTTGTATPVDQTVGLRFQRVMIPQGATITGATLEFQAAQSESESANLEIRAQDADDAPVFSAATTDISSRTTTSASVFWENVPAWTSGQRYQSPDLTSVVQQVVNRTEWCGGNAMAFIITGTPASRRTAESFDGDSTGAPILSISYDPDSVDDDACINQTFQARVVSGIDDVEQASNGSMYTDSSDLELVDDGGIQTIGIRFRNVTIPKDTEIVGAELVFQTDETTSGVTSLTISGEAADDSAQFTTAANDVTDRTSTEASVSWAPGAWATVGETHTTPDLGEVVGEIVGRAGWESGNAMTFIITGTGKRVAEAYEGDVAGAPMLRVYVRGSLGTGYQTVRDKLLEIVDGLNYKTGTPILDTLYEAASYYRGEPVHYGKTRGFGDDPDDGSFGESDRNRSQYTRVSHPASYTGGAVTRPAGCTEDAPNSTACIDETISGDATYITPVTEWCQSNYQILLSDGLGYGEQSVSLVNGNLLSDDYSCSNHDNCSVELAEFLHREDQNGDLKEDQTVTTYTIGFNLESTDPQFLTDVANAGGGSFHTADTASDLSAVFQAILADILKRSTSFTAPAVSVNAFNKLFHDNEVYFSLFLPERSVRWNGNLKKYTICVGEESDTCTRGDILDANGDDAIGANNRFDANSQSYWSAAADGNEVKEGGAGENAPAYSSRVVYTYTGAGSPSSVSLGADAYTINSDDAANVTTDLLRTLLGASALPDAEYSKLIYWILGKDVNDEDDDAATDDDRWTLADPLHSQPLVVTFGKEGSTSIKKIFLGTNDGFLRMINASTGVEEWAFLPKAMLDRQRELMTNSNGDHIYGMDGDVTAWIVDADQDGVIEPGADKVWIFASMRRGGRNIYALDVTPGSTLASASSVDGIVPTLLWRIEGGVSTGFGQLGQTWSSPTVADIPYGGSSKKVLLFGGGYDASQDSTFGSATVGNAIYAVDITDGSLVWSVSGSGSGATVELASMDYPIPSKLTLLDSNGDGLTDRIYVGDTGGQLWRLDLGRSETGGTVSGARLAVVSSDSDDADKRKFFYPPDVAQLSDSDYSDTSEYDLVVIVSGDRANPTATSVHDRVYAFRDYLITGSIPSDFSPISPATDLFDATANLIQQGTGEQVEAAVEALRGKDGWYFDLRDGTDWVGEKGLSAPIILDNKMFFTTYVPGAGPANADICGSPVEGSGRLYAVNILNGASVYPNWDGLGDTSNYTAADRDYDLWAGIPSSVVPVFQPTGVLLVVGGGGGGGTFDPDIPLPIIRTFWMHRR